MLGCESIVCHAQAFLRPHARDAVEKMRCINVCYARYRADVVRHGIAGNDSLCSSSVMEPAAVI
jgi:hypothetical protein